MLLLIFYRTNCPSTQQKRELLREISHEVRGNYDPHIVTIIMNCNIDHVHIYPSHVQ